LTGLSVLFMGTSDFAVPTLEAIAQGRDRVVAVVTQPDKPSGRRQQLAAPPVKVAAQRMGITVLQPPSLKEDDAYQALVALRPDVCVVAAYGQILRQRVLDIPALGCFNVHASLLPRWRGAAPISWAIGGGDEETGVTIMRMERGLDTGPMWVWEATGIGPEETAGELSIRLAQMGARLMAKCLTALRSGESGADSAGQREGDLCPIRQKRDSAVASSAPQAFVRHVMP
jgi:methionyl-tRNA formyltransferase